MNKDLLLEIGTEEIPAKFLPGMLLQLKQLVQNQLESSLIKVGNIDVYATPRRLAFIAHDIPKVQDKSTMQNKGPSVKIAYDKDGNLSKAALGFARGQGVEADRLIEKDGYLYAEKTVGGQATFELLPDILLSIINSLNFPKSMRWADLDFRFVRPIHWFVALFDDKIIEFEKAGVRSSNESFGHRFLSKGKITIKKASDYVDTLKEHFVLAQPDKREEIILAQIQELAKKTGGSVPIDKELLEEVVHLVEYPTALIGNFDKEFLALPKEAIITPMKEHQRYFPVLDDEGNLMPCFITVRNGDDRNIDVIANGNQRVLRARLSDAQFFFNEDKKTSLYSRLDKLKTVVFQEGLGSIYDKTLRIGNLSEFFVQNAFLQEDVQMPFVDRTALLCKTDLVTGMVCEFTELQGVMGREYAILDGENSAVAEGIFEHYLPRFSGDILPKGYCGKIVGVCDKLDNIVATFSRGLIPTGSQDPYALRRQAIGIINILLQADYNISLSALIEKNMQLLKVDKPELVEQITEFFKLRIKNIMLEDGLRYDIVDSVLAVGIDDITITFKRVQALQEFSQDKEQMQLLVRAFTRIDNISKKAKLDNAAVDDKLFEDDAEKQLYNAFKAAQQSIDESLAKCDYLATLNDLSKIVAPVNNFFDSVMVMHQDEKMKNNRLALLQQISGLASSIADFNCIVE